MSALSHAKRNPHARATTLAHLIVQDRKTDQLQAEVANFDHVPGILTAELESVLSGFSREQRERIEESF